MFFSKRCPSMVRAGTPICYMNHPIARFLQENFARSRYSRTATVVSGKRQRTDGATTSRNGGSRCLDSLVEMFDSDWDFACSLSLTQVLSTKNTVGTFRP